MHFRDISETGSYARFFVQMIAMYLIAMALGFCLITAAYVWSARDGAVAPDRGCSNWGRSVRTGIGTPVMVRLAQPMIDAVATYRLEEGLRNFAIGLAVLIPITAKARSRLLAARDQP